jgi:hypothetical protein
MSAKESPAQRRGLVAIDGAMALIIVLLIVQVWLLSATLEAFLSGHAQAALPAAICSGLIFFACVALNLFVDHVDQDSRLQSLERDIERS